MSDFYDDVWEQEFRDEFDPLIDCSRCHGSGEVPTADYESYTGDNYKECPECNGTGEKRDYDS